MGFQPWVGLEVAGDGFVSWRDHQNDLVNPGLGRLLHHVLEHGLVENGQKYLGQRFGHRQKPGAHTGGGDHCFTYLHLVH